MHMNSLEKLMNLRGRNALITGAVGGLGKQMAITIAELGGDLILLDRPNSDYKNLLNTLNNFEDISVDVIDCDLENGVERSKIIEMLLSEYNGLDILINNAAFVGNSDLEGWQQDFEDQTVETWRRVLEVNLTSVFDLCKGLTPLLKKTKRGTIINVASIYALVGPINSLYENTIIRNPAAYAASKGGLVQLTRWLATTLAPDIRVNAISPGGVYTGQPEKFVQRYNAQTPMARMANYDDFKGATAYLASDLSAYVTGHNLVVDGGWTIW